MCPISNITPITIRLASLTSAARDARLSPGAVSEVLQKHHRHHGIAAERRRHCRAEVPHRRERRVHTTVLATQQAELAFELGLQVRNKVVSAYQEIMKMQM